ncbi:unnamed protein product [Allacma fusca]|uniref:diacylglycerol O-acyltransferase n=1 Tax=Allacma fusca TaxID=39272 RepID=A0A8J2JSA7_9HEXA|nr:unnamed protein product [Allacma fusca]
MNHQNQAPWMEIKILTLHQCRDSKNLKKSALRYALISLTLTKDVIISVSENDSHIFSTASLDLRKIAPKTLRPIAGMERMQRELKEPNQLSLFATMMDSDVMILQYFVFKLAPLVRPDLGKMLSTKSALFATDDIYNRPLTPIVIKYVIEGTPDIIRVKELILNNWIKAKYENGSPRFGELTHYVSHWMGFAFWTPEKKFNIGEHVKIKGSESGFTTETQLTVYMNELSTKPYEKYKSPWELIIVPNIVRERFADRTPRSAVIINFHHCLTDGFGLLTLMSKISSSVVGSGVESKSPEKKVLARQQKISLGGICKGVYFLLRAPYDFISYMIVKVDPTKYNSWHLPEAELEKEWTISPATEHISSELVKEIKNCYGVSFNAVILAAFTGSIRNVMLCHPTKKVPDFIRVSVPVPVSSHPGKLRNVWYRLNFLHFDEFECECQFYEVK